MKRGSRRDPDVGRTELLQAATQLFAAHGFERTTLAAVGKRAGVSRGLAAYFFGSKKRLYAAVMERAAETVRTAVVSPGSSELDDAPIDQMLTVIVNSYTDFLAANPDLVRLLQWEWLRPAHGREPSPVAVFDSTVPVVNRALRRSGCTNVDARLLLFSVVGMCFFPFATAPDGRRPTAFLARYKKHVVRMLMTGIRGTS